MRLGAGTGLTLAGHCFDVDLDLRNLCNTRYASFLSRYKAYAQAAGRTAVLRLTTEV